VRISILVFVVVLFLAGDCLGHTCRSNARATEKEFQMFLDSRQAIFFGEVISIEPRINNWTQRIGVRVIRTWKGTGTAEVSMLYVGVSYPFETEIGGIGTQKIFYATMVDNGSLQVRFCDFDSQTVDERMQTALGEGLAVERPTPTPQPEEVSFWTWLWQKIGVCI